MKHEKCNSIKELQDNSRDLGTHRIAKLMVHTCKQHNLPNHYHNDVNIDFNTITVILKIEPEFREFIWILRDSGSTLVPLHIGAESNAVEFYSDMRDYPEAKYFICNLKKLEIHPITVEDATIKSLEQVKLAALSYIITGGVLWVGAYKALGSHDTVYFKVIDRGIALGLWGVFHPPTREFLTHRGNALAYFQEQSNSPMVEFIKKLYPEMK